MNNSKLLFGQIMSNRIKTDRGLNWRLIKKIKHHDVKYEPEELYYYSDNGVYCCTTDVSSWSVKEQLPKATFKVEYN